MWPSDLRSSLLAVLYPGNQPADLLPELPLQLRVLLKNAHELPDLRH